MSLNVWEYKPKWCQPWSIILSGIVAIAGVWLLTKVIWLTVVLSLLIAVWWFYFLIIYPKAFAQYLANQEIKLEGEK